MLLLTIGTYLAAAAAVILLGVAAQCAYFWKFNVVGENGPPATFVLGCIPLIRKNRERIYSWLAEMAEKHGDPFHLSVPLLRKATVVITHPEHVKHVLKDHFEHYEKAELKTRMRALLGDGIFNSDGELWRRQRKTASHMFSVRAMREYMTGVIVGHADELVSQLRAGSDVEMSERFYRFTLDSIGHIGFGVSLDTLKKDDVPFARAFDVAQAVAEGRGYHLFWQYKPWSKPERDMRAAMRVLHSFAAEVIAVRAKEDRSTLERRMDLLSQFMLGSDDRQWLADIILNFMIAGRDTTAVGLSWTMLELCQHADVQTRLVEEMAEQLDDGTPLHYDGMKKLTYMQAVLSEVMRLHPPVPGDMKYCVKDDVLPGVNGQPDLHIPAGTEVVYLPFGTGRRKDVWGDDALQFKPERWLADSAPTQFEYPIFNAGPRLCLGMHMAYLEMKIMLASLLRKFTLSLTPGQKVEYKPGITLMLRSGISVHLAARE